MFDQNVRRRLFLIVAFLAGAIVQPAWAASQAEKRDCNQAQDVNLTIAACTRILVDKREPISNRAVAAGLRCAAYSRLGDLVKATADCMEATRLTPRDTKSWNNLGRIRGMGRDIDGAVAAYDMALRLDPRNSVAMTSLAFAWREKGNLDRAIAMFSEAILIDPQNAQIFMGRAIARGEKGDFDNALADASEAIRLYPTWSQLYNERGTIWRLKGDLEHALQDQNRAVELGGDTQRAAEQNYSARGDTYRYLGQFDRALADYDGALKLRPGYIPAHTGRGLTFEKMGDLIRAKAEFEKALNSTTQFKSDFSRSGVDTARVHLDALDSGIAPPSIPAAPAKAESATSIPTPKVIIPASSLAAHANQGRRVALVIGNSAYRNVPALANPERDAGVVAGSLRAIGFDTVMVETNDTREKMVDVLRNFAGEADKADWAMVYYAGHGIEMGGINYLIPVDARFATDRDVQFEAIPFDQVMAALDGARKLKLVLLDACRDNPFAPKVRVSEPAAAVPASTAGAKVGTRSIGRGLGDVRVSGATLVVFAAKQGHVALDGDGENSPFAVAVVQRIATPGVEINKVFRLVRDDVMEATAGRQEPYTYGSLPGSEDLYFVQR